MLQVLALSWQRGPVNPVVHAQLQGRAGQGRGNKQQVYTRQLSGSSWMMHSMAWVATCSEVAAAVTNNHSVQS
jgi:hypothetical protein